MGDDHVVGAPDSGVIERVVRLEAGVEDVEKNAESRFSRLDEERKSCRARSIAAASDLSAKWDRDFSTIMTCINEVKDWIRGTRQQVGLAEEVRGIHKALKKWNRLGWIVITAMVGSFVVAAWALRENGKQPAAAAIVATVGDTEQDTRD